MGIKCNRQALFTATITNDASFKYITTHLPSPHPFIHREIILFHFVRKISEGTTTIVLKLKSHEQIFYALKIYKTGYYGLCAKERSVMDHIHQCYRHGIANHTVHIPRVIKYLHVQPIDCRTHGAILMEFIEGVTLSEIKPFTANDGYRILSALTDAMIDLGLLGFCYFGLDLNSIIRNHHGQYYLMGWRDVFYLKSQHVMDWKTHGKTPIGSNVNWFHYSSQLLILNNMREHEYQRIMHSMMRNITHPSMFSVSNIENWMSLIIDANLYSLQAMVFTRLCSVSDACREFNIAINDTIWLLKRTLRMNTNYMGRKKLIRNSLQGIWSLRHCSLRRYFEMNHDTMLNQEMFALLIPNKAVSELQYNVDNPCINIEHNQPIGFLQNNTELIVAESHTKPKPYNNWIIKCHTTSYKNGCCGCAVS
eukprot:860099_1